MYCSLQLLNLCYQVKLWNLTITRQPSNYQCKHYGPQWPGCVSIFKCGFVAFNSDNISEL